MYCEALHWFRICLPGKQPALAAHPIPAPTAAETPTTPATQKGAKGPSATQKALSARPPAAPDAAAAPTTVAPAGEQLCQTLADLAKRSDVYIPQRLKCMCFCGLGGCEPGIKQHASSNTYTQVMTHLHQHQNHNPASCVLIADGGHFCSC